MDAVIHAWERIRHDPDKWIQNIAKGLTNTIRQQNQATTTDYMGIMYTQELYIVIRPIWLLYAGFILLSGLLFFTVAAGVG
ncbi:hypothetical protein F4860DRAFT_465732 [Xylaria cubensis]|nr:hypothetical protein F4860DRAFT_465732 [Xylaria cubensis]